MNELRDYETRPFYVVYDSKDNVRFCGTAQQLIREYKFNNLNQLNSLLSKIRHGKVKGFVVTIFPQNT